MARAKNVMERKFWGHYMEAFEEAIRATASKHAPWFVVPADNKSVHRPLFLRPDRILVLQNFILSIVGSAELDNFFICLAGSPIE